MVKNLPAVQETWVRSLGRQDLLQKGVATHSSVLAWRSPWTEKPDGLQSMGSKESDTTERLTVTDYTDFRTALVGPSPFRESLFYPQTLLVLGAHTTAANMTARFLSFN